MANLSSAAKKKNALLFAVRISLRNRSRLFA